MTDCLRDPQETFEGSKVSVLLGVLWHLAWGVLSFAPLLQVSAPRATPCLCRNFFVGTVG
jgi:hypothetical protein